jgi:hypothetical protein
MSSPNNSTKRTSSFLRNPASLQVLRENLLLAKTTLGEDSHAYRLLREKIKVATQAQLTASNQHGQQPLPPPQQQQKKYTTRDQMPSPSTTAPPPDPAELEPAPEQDSDKRLTQEVLHPSAARTSAAAHARQLDLMAEAAGATDAAWQESSDKWMGDQAERTSIGQALTQARVAPFPSTRA